jgi:hypothetical protein
LELVSYPDRSGPQGEVSQNVMANQTETKRKRGGQKGNGNARKHGFYSDTLSPAQAQQVWNIINREGVDFEIAAIRVKLQSSLEANPGNRRVIGEASRLLVKWYSQKFGLDSTDRGDLKNIVENILETVAARPAELQGWQK